MMLLISRPYIHLLYLYQSISWVTSVYTSKLGIGLWLF